MIGYRTALAEYNGFRGGGRTAAGDELVLRIEQPPAGIAVLGQVPANRVPGLVRVDVDEKVFDAPGVVRNLLLFCRAISWTVSVMAAFSVKLCTPWAPRMCPTF